MNKAVQPSRAKAALLLVICTCMVTQAQQLPSDTAIARESVKQAPRTEAAISKAERQARQLRMPVPDVGRPPVLSVPDPAAIAKRYQSDQRPDAGLFVLVSLTMPPGSLDRLAAQAGKAGATLVLRGMLGGSFKKTTELIADIIRKHPGTQFHIDPTLFRRFNVVQVPTFVLTVRPEDNQTCGRDCDANNTFARVAGDVSLDYALEHLSKQGDQRFAHLAGERLKQIRGQL
ncbi:type-F conjugative transfer system pilin assembly protein TrbC [Janthinobacterium sp. J1-1]|uniref:type-F conjugative transfer system pilin assembly protein TrbC n=1 Tax=Janthinobacterium sp. J1-1 TaxID=3065910 RepID=UPI0028120122|nr:type-F conjugative transfer system pilin assembly protein TrbC [Janthinobacterium sp. J1-1]